MASDVVIVGGGFGGLYAARRLEVVPLREELDWTEIRLGRVTGADPDRNAVHVHTVGGRDETIRYDQLILTPGSVSRMLPVPGLEEHALGFKTLADTRFVPVEVQDRVMQEIPAPLAEFASRELRGRGMEIWTAGVAPAPVVRKLGLPLSEQGRIDADATMKVKGRENVWAISYRTLGVFVDMGQHKAVATVLGVRLTGFPAWFAARTYHLMMMPGVARKVRLGLDWGVGLFFGRGSAQLGQLGHPAALREPDGER